MRCHPTIKRVFVVEPNLINNLGHMYGVVYLLWKYLKGLGHETILIGNRSISKELMKKLPSVWPLIDQSIFENLADKGKIFSANLEKLHEYYLLSGDDLIVIPTVYTNQLYGLKIFLNKSHIKSHFALLIHQLYRPANDFYETCTKQFRDQSYKQLVRSCQSLPKNVSLWSTDSYKLNKTLCQLLRREVGILPIPYTLNGQLPYKRYKKISKGPPVLTFLGDNRFEKGLNILFKIIDARNPYFYIIQFNTPRCYGIKALSNLNKDILNIRGLRNVEFINKIVDDNQFNKIIDITDAIILPYHPLSYGKRISGVLIQCLLHGVPAVTTKHTWSGELVNKYQCGTTFFYSNNINKNKKRLNEAIDKLFYNYTYYLQNVKNISPAIAEKYSAKTFMEIIIKQI